MNEPKVTQTRGVFSMVCGVDVNIRAGAEAIWAILTDAKAFPDWNSTVTSVEGRGSAFTFDLPLTWVSPPAAAAAADEAEPGLPPLRILAAEDNKTNQLLLAAMLDPMDVVLHITADGAEAVEAFRDEPFDIVLMDIQMPVMNGVDAVRAMRALEAERGQAPTPILALSANVMRHQIDEYMAAGMNGFVAKPIEMSALVGGIEQALAGAAEAQSAAA